MSWVTSVGVGELVESSDEEEEDAEEVEQETAKEREEVESKANNGPEGGERAEEPSSKLPSKIGLCALIKAVCVCVYVFPWCLVQVAAEIMLPM